MTAVFILALLVAILDWVAVARNWRKVEYVAKPATMVLLLGWLAFAGGFGTPRLVCFGLGVFFSLVGDTLIMIPSERWFMAALVAFLLAHAAYIIGLNIPLPQAPLVFSVGIGAVLALAAGRLLRRIIDGVRGKGLRRLVAPVAVYGVVMTITLFSALLTLYNPDWKTSSAGLVALGAALFFFSDLLLGWNKFVKPVGNGRLLDMILYHLGQFALVAGVVAGAGVR